MTQKDKTKEELSEEMELLKKRIVELEARGVERKKAEDASVEEKVKYKTLVDNIPQKIFFKDRNSVYITCNENFSKDLRIEAEKISGKTDYDFFTEEMAEKYRADDKRIMESGKIEDIEEKYIENGKERYVHTIKAPARDEHGSMVGVLGIFWDITEQKQLEKAERENIKKMEVFYKAAMGREERILELKKEVEKLKKELGR